MARPAQPSRAASYRDVQVRLQPQEGRGVRQPLPLSAGRDARCAVIRFSFCVTGIRVTGLTRSVIGSALNFSKLLLLNAVSPSHSPSTRPGAKTHRDSDRTASFG